MIHPTPLDEAQSALWRQLKEGTLPQAETWEQQLSSGADKKSVWEQLLRDRKLGYTALLKNLRNMQQVGVSPELMDQAIKTLELLQVFPAQHPFHLYYARLEQLEKFLDYLHQTIDSHELPEVTLKEIHAEVRELVSCRPPRGKPEEAP